MRWSMRLARDSSFNRVSRAWLRVAGSSWGASWGARDWLEVFGGSCATRSGWVVDSFLR